jgi:ParB family chromosome partitioning protein
MDCPEYLLAEIAPDPHQPRKFFDQPALDELIESVKARGVLQPIVLTRNPDPEAARTTPYLVLFGERRLRAATAAGLTTIPALLEERPLDAGERLLRQLAENDVRKDLTLFERASSLAHLLENSELSRNELADKLGISKSWVTHMLAIAEFDGPAREATSSGTISRAATARRFARLPVSAQSALLAHSRSRSLPISLAVVASAEGRAKRRARAPGATATTVRFDLSLFELHHLLTLAGLPLEPTLQGAADALRTYLLAQVSQETPS